MKITKSFIAIVFICIICVPAIFFNFEPNSVSKIDNRMLAESPFSKEAKGSLTQRIENYVNDRIGLRDRMISAYTMLNNKVFGKMVHPSYSYGTNGYVFGSGLSTKGQFSDFHVCFADMVANIQEYCEIRGVPFVFVLNPAKPAVLTQYIPRGINYSRDWVDKFFAELDKRNVNYIDNTVILKEKTDNGEVVFNKKYDANHWNYLGAYYGTNNILKTLKKQLPNVHINTLDEFNISEKIETSLPASDFPIKESVPVFSPIYKPISNTQKYSSEIELHPSYNSFGSFINEKRATEDAPSALVFQGSYMNGKGSIFLSNSFKEYNHVHDYQNVIDMPYYFNIFNPNCVIFEVAEYTFLDGYFSHEKMKQINYNKPLKNYENCKSAETNIAKEDLDVVEQTSLTKIIWNTSSTSDYAWLLLDGEYDMKKTDKGYEVTIKTVTYKEHADKMELVTYSNNTITRHKVSS